MEVYVVSAFVPLRGLLAGNRELVSRLEDVEKNPSAGDDAGYLRKEHQNAGQTDVWRAARTNDSAGAKQTPDWFCLSDGKKVSQRGAKNNGCTCPMLFILSNFHRSP